MHESTGKAIMEFQWDCCMDLDCSGHDGWVFCETIGSDRVIWLETMEAWDEHNRKARMLARFGADAIGDDDLAMAYDKLQGGRR